MSGYIPREQLSAYTRWQLETFDEPAAPVMAAEVTPDPAEAEEVMPSGYPLPTAEELERIHAEAHDTGYQAGFATGQQEGQQSGYEAGYTAGLEEARQALEPVAAQMQTFATNLQEAFASMDQGVAEDVLALSLELARQMVRGALEVRQELILPVVRDAIAALPLQQHGLRLHVNPVNAELIRSHLGEQFAHSGWKIMEDNSVEPGGCMLHGGGTEVDGSVATRWQRILASIGLSRDWLKTHLPDTPPAPLVSAATATPAEAPPATASTGNTGHSGHSGNAAPDGE